MLKLRITITGEMKSERIAALSCFLKCRANRYKYNLTQKVDGYKR